MTGSRGRTTSAHPGVPSAVLGIVIRGIAAIRTGRVFRRQRRHVQWPAAFGRAQPARAAALPRRTS
ncbi:hypothetical protein [Streptomyces sp. NBC_01268]|uniref:hypothetical protein n=1 Tax=Streptomyces sp. NBC_01268 TaxID=2903806 RepID=UPI002E36BFB7|nr:hypothetical protein [Streptomyces sp. NBC_01268]